MSHCCCRRRRRLREENQQLQWEMASLRVGGGGRASASGAGARPWANDPCATTASGSAVAIQPLAFSVEALVLLGSPLGCFLALRGVSHGRGRGLGTAPTVPLMQSAPGQPCAPDGLPMARRLWNVYHPRCGGGHGTPGMGHTSLPSCCC